jgi:formate-dependent nitrite reductase membrane component NrfD
MGGGLGKVVGFLQKLKGLARVLDWIAFILAILLIAYTGVLLSAASPPLWSSTFLLPALFVASAVATGIAILNVAGAAGIDEVGPGLMAKLCKAGAVVCTVEILALAGLLLLTAGAISTPVAYAAEGATHGHEVSTAALETVKSLLTGPYSFAFWVGVVLVGLVLPLGVEFGMILRGVEKPAREVAVVLGLMVLVGGFILRAVVVFGGQI